MRALSGIDSVVPATIHGLWHSYSQFVLPPQTARGATAAPREGYPGPPLRESANSKSKAKGLRCEALSYIFDRAETIDALIGLLDMFPSGA